MADAKQLQKAGDIDGLVAMFDGPFDEQWDAVQALVAIGVPAVPRLLEALLSGHSDNASWRAAQALTTIEPQAVPAAPLLQGLASEVASVRRWSALVVQKVAPPIGDPTLRSRMADALLTLLGDSEKDVRRYAADALAGVVGSNDRGRLVQQLRHDDPMVRQGVAAALGQVGTVEELEPLIKVLRDPERMARMNAAQALGKLGAGITDPATRARVVAALVRALKDFDFGIRSYAARALGMIGDGSAIEPLQALANDPELQIRDDAAKALLQLAESRHA
jgi:HEAT repeat protein